MTKELIARATDLTVVGLVLGIVYVVRMIHLLNRPLAR